MRPARIQGSLKLASRLAALLCLLLAVPAIALAVDVSEVCTSNQKAYVIDGLSPDWIELHNPDGGAVDLSDYWISDDEDKPEMFRLTGYSIAPGGYLLLKADGVELPFKLSASGCTVLLTKGGTTVSRVDVPPLAGDETYSLQLDGRYQVTAATPLQANVPGHAYVAPVYVDPPVLSAPSGFYEAGFTLAMEGYGDTRVYYTLDGTVPDANAALYQEPLTVDDASFHINHFSALTHISLKPVTAPKVLLPKATIVRAVAIDAEGNRSRVVTSAYFIGFAQREGYQGLPVLSIVADADALFGEENGVYMLGKRYADWLAVATNSLADTPINNIPTNYRVHGRESEIAASVQLFTEDRALALEQNVGMRVHGNFSRHDAQKSLKLYARSEYGGGSNICYRFWPEGEKAPRVIVRNGGNNHVLMFLDAFAHDLLSERGIPVCQSTPCLLFLNGEDWGIYNLRESQDEDYIADRFGVDASSVVLIKNGALQEGIKGDFALYEDFMASVSGLICTLPEEYAALEKRMDIDSYTQYLAGGVYVECVDWLNIDNNFTLWRTRGEGTGPYEDGRWRWIYQDLDYSCGWGSSDPTPVELLLKEEIFSALWTNADYRDRFLTCIMDIANIDCSAARVGALLDAYAARYRPYMANLYNRFYPDTTLDDFDQQVESIRTFFRDRPTQIAQQLTKALKLDRDVYTLNLSLPETQDAVFTLNGRTVETSGAWGGLYFSGCPLTLRAEEIPGYRFAGWYEEGALLSAEAELTLELTKDTVLTPRYEENTLLAAIGKEYAPRVGSDGDFALYSGKWSYDAAFAADDGLAVTLETGALKLQPLEKWKKNAGFTLRLSSAGCGGLLAVLTLNAEEGAPERWTLSCGVGGAADAEVTDFVLNAGTNVVTVPLPAYVEDTDAISLRASVAKKPSQKSAACVTLQSLRVYGAPKDVSLAAYKRTLARCQDAFGAEYAPPEGEALAALTQTEVNDVVRRMRAELASALARAQTGTVAEVIGSDAETLEGLEDCAAIRITDEIATLASAVPVAADAQHYPSGVSLYRWENGRLTLADTLAPDNGQVSIPARVGTYLLLDQTVDARRCTLAFRTDAPGEALMESAFSGLSPEGYLWLDVETRTRYQEAVTFQLPDGSGLRTRHLWRYAYVDGALQDPQRLTADESGAFTLDPPTQGTYLLLTKTLDAYRSEADYLAKQEDTPDEAPKDNRMPVYLGAAGIAVLALIGLTIGLIRLRRRKKEERSASDENASIFQ